MKSTAPSTTTTCGLSQEKVERYHVIGIMKIVEGRCQNFHPDGTTLCDCVLSAHPSEVFAGSHCTLVLIEEEGPVTAGIAGSVSRAPFHIWALVG